MGFIFCPLKCEGFYLLYFQQVSLTFGRAESLLALTALFASTKSGKGRKKYTSTEQICWCIPSFLIPSRANCLHFNSKLPQSWISNTVLQPRQGLTSPPQFLTKWTCCLWTRALTRLRSSHFDDRNFKDECRAKMKTTSTNSRSGPYPAISPRRAAQWSSLRSWTYATPSIQFPLVGCARWACPDQPELLLCCALAILVVAPY